MNYFSFTAFYLPGLWHIVSDTSGMKRARQRPCLQPEQNIPDMWAQGRTASSQAKAARNRAVIANTNKCFLYDAGPAPQTGNGRFFQPRARLTDPTVQRGVSSSLLSVPARVLGGSRMRGQVRPLADSNVRSLSLRGRGAVLSPINFI